MDLLVCGIDAKTTDDTREVIAKACGKRLAVKFFDFTLEQEDGAADFAAARNKSFSEVGPEYEWVLWLDTDDVLTGKRPLRDLLAELPPSVGKVYLPYLYHRDEAGNLTTVYDRERAIRQKFGPWWKGRLHEWCETRLACEHVRSESLWVEHKNIAKSQALDVKGTRNLTTLEAILKGDPNDTRAMLYSAHQYFASFMWHDAIEWYDRYIRTPTPGDPVEERWQASIFLAKAKIEVGDYAGAVNTATSALHACPQYQDSYFTLARAFAQMRHWTKAVHWHEQALDKQKPDRILMVNPQDYSDGFNPWSVIHTAYYNLKKYDQAIDAVSRALEFRPDDSTLQWRKRFYVGTKERSGAIQAGMQLAMHLTKTNETLKAEKLLELLPAGAEDDEQEMVLGARQKIGERVAFLRDPIAYENHYITTPEKLTASEERLDIVDTGLPRMKWMREHLRAIGAKKVLEVGIGDGVEGFYFARHGLQVVGLDIDPLRVKQANFLAVKKGYMRKSWSRRHRRTIPTMRRDAQIQFHYIEPNAAIGPAVTALGPFDAVVLSEVIEHVEDIDKLLAPYEALGVPMFVSTPDGGFPGTIGLNESHVRAWSRTELERTFSKRGWIQQSHRVIHPMPGEQDNLMLMYEPGEQARTTRMDRPPISIYCGAGFEQWDPDSPNRGGIGGSETAVICVARELAKMGLRVTVWGPTEGVWDGVAYRSWRKWTPHVPAWLTIVWRRADVFEQPLPASQLKWLWLHDTGERPEITPARAENIDTVLVLSKWHRQHIVGLYPHLKEKLVIVGNGIDPERFTAGPERIPDRFLYTSSPDRGLEQVLDYWPDIRKFRPEASLRIAYGWNIYDMMGGNPEYKRAISRAIAHSEGVEWLGRVNQKQLAQEMTQASVLLYPGPHHFLETFCISVIEAQAAGCVPLTRDTGALPEVNQWGLVLPNDSPREKWVKAAITAASYSTSRRLRMAAWAKEQTWARVAARIVGRAMADTRRLYPEEANAEANAGADHPGPVLPALEALPTGTD